VASPAGALGQPSEGLAGSHPPTTVARRSQPYSAPPGNLRAEPSEHGCSWHPGSSVSVARVRDQLQRRVPPPSARLPRPQGPQPRDMAVAHGQNTAVPEGSSKSGDFSWSIRAITPGLLFSQKYECYNSMTVGEAVHEGICVSCQFPT
jgi:hypothetical protein